jgi:hypothetical protein
MRLHDHAAEADAHQRAGGQGEQGLDVHDPALAAEAESALRDGIDSALRDGIDLALRDGIDLALRAGVPFSSKARTGTSVGSSATSMATIIALAQPSG